MAKRIKPNQSAKWLKQYHSMSNQELLQEALKFKRTTLNTSTNPRIRHRQNLIEQVIAARQSITNLLLDVKPESNGSNDQMTMFGQLVNTSFAADIAVDDLFM